MLKYEIGLFHTKLNFWSFPRSYMFSWRKTSMLNCFEIHKRMNLSNLWEKKRFLFLFEHDSQDLQNCLNCLPMLYSNKSETIAITAIHLGPGNKYHVILPRIRCQIKEVLKFNGALPVLIKIGNEGCSLWDNLPSLSIQFKLIWEKMIKKKWKRRWMVWQFISKRFVASHLPHDKKIFFSPSITD